MKDFIKQAIQTEAPIKPDLMERYEGLLGTLAVYLDEMINLGDSVDKIKKFIFYGKETDLPPNPGPRITAAQAVRFVKCVRDLHGLVGKMTEIGELAQQYAEYIFDGKELDVTNVMEEIGDDFYYNAIICDARGFTFEQCQERVIAKLRVRYPNKFSEYDALNRNLLKERKALESFNQDAKN